MPVLRSQLSTVIYVFMLFITDIKCVSAGVVSIENQYPPPSGKQEDYLSSGPMCRYAEDLQLMLKIMAGPNAHK